MGKTHGCNIIIQRCLPEVVTWLITLTGNARCRGVEDRPALVAQFEFVEWTADGHLRHVNFVGLRFGTREK